MRFPGQEEVQAQAGRFLRCRHHPGGTISNKTIAVKVESKKLRCLMYLVPRMATALVFFVCARNEGLDRTNAQYVTSKTAQSATVFCGPTLTNAMQLVCNGVYNPPIIQKSGGNQKRLEDWAIKNQENYAIYPFRTRRNALSLNENRVFRRRSAATTIVNECCRKACTVMEMRNYCGR